MTNLVVLMRFSSVFYTWAKKKQQNVATQLLHFVRWNSSFFELNNFIKSFLKFLRIE